MFIIIIFSSSAGLKILMTPTLEFAHPWLRPSKATSVLGLERREKHSAPPPLTLLHADLKEEVLQHSVQDHQVIQEHFP